MTRVSTAATARRVRTLASILRRSLDLVYRSGRYESIVIVVLSLVQALVTVGQLFVVSRVVAQLPTLADSRTIAPIVPETVALVVLLLAQSSTQLYVAEKRIILGDLLARRAQSIVAEAAVAADLEYFERPAFHDRLYRALGNATTRPLMLVSALITIITAVAVSVALVAALAAVQPLVLLVVAAGAGPIWLTTRWSTKLGFDFTLAESEDERRRSYFLFMLTAKEYAKEIRSNELGRHVDDRRDQLWVRRLVRLRAMIRKRLKYGLVNKLVNSALVGGVLLLLAWTLATGRTDPSNALVAAGAIVLVGQRISAIGSSIGVIYECALFINDLDEFLVEFGPSRSDDVLGEAPEQEHIAAARQVEPLRTLAAKNLTYAYPSGRGNAIEDVSIEVERDQVVALVGANGSGKSTLALLLAGLLEPSSGELLRNHVPIEFGDPAWRGDSSIMLQDFARYMLTLEENVGFGRVEEIGNADRTATALTNAGLDDLFRSLPDGAGSLLGPEFIGGTNVSVGQWQRIALARAFFRDASLLILDEPSAALDPDAEARLFDTLRSVCAGRAVVLISHRFSSVRSADRIYVMADGRVIERGTHAELMSQHTTYRRLFEVQARQYADPLSSDGGVA